MARPPTPTTPTTPPIIAAVERLQELMIERLGMRSIPTREEILTEAISVARMAAVGGDLPTALKGYESVGKMLGIGGETHNHLHLHQTPNAMVDADDATLSAMLHESKKAPRLLTPEEAVHPVEPVHEPIGNPLLD